MIVKVTAVAAPGTEPGSLHWAQAVPSAALEMPVLIPAGPPALARGFGGQVRGLEVWQAPGGVRCDTGAFSTGSPQTPSCAPQRSPGWWVPLLLQLVCPQAAPQIAHTSYRHSPIWQHWCDSGTAQRRSLRPLSVDGEQLGESQGGGMGRGQVVGRAGCLL